VVGHQLLLVKGAKVLNTPGFKSSPELMRPMDIESYFQKREDQYTQSNLVKNYKVFDYNYIPEKPLMRQECRPIIDALMRFKVSGIPTNMSIIGSRGSGKTLTLQYLRKMMEKRKGLDMVYVNCRHHNTSFKIFSQLLGQENVAGSSLVNLYERFVREYPRKTVIILDEINLMSPKDKNREILYFLSRSEKPYMVVMLSNTPHILKQLDAATKSSLQPFPLYFCNYNAGNIYQILLDRAQKGLHSWDEGEISKISALTTKKTNSDARVAIKTLFYRVMAPENPIDQCFEDARRDLILDVINDLMDTNLMILWAAATGKSDLAKDIYNRYCRFSHDHGVKPFSYVYFYANLSYLQSVGLLALISTKVDRAYANRVLLTFDKSIAEQICKLRFD
jgi:Cdc6-like AAA superfamily ATPase